MELRPGLETQDEKFEELDTVKVQNKEMRREMTTMRNQLNLLSKEMAKRHQDSKGQENGNKKEEKPENSM